MRLNGEVIVIEYSNRANVASALTLLRPRILYGSALFRPMVPFRRHPPLKHRARICYYFSPLQLPASLATNEGAVKIMSQQGLGYVVRDPAGLSKLPLGSCVTLLGRAPERLCPSP